MTPEQIKPVSNDLLHYKIVSAAAQRVADQRWDRIQEMEVEIECNNDLIRKMEADAKVFEASNAALTSEVLALRAQRECDKARIAEVETALSLFSGNPETIMKTAGWTTMNPEFVATFRIKMDDLARARAAVRKGVPHADD